MLIRETASRSNNAFTVLHVIGVDGSGEAILEFMYKDMIVDSLKRSITSKLRMPAFLWEDLILYHLGVVMKNGQTLGHCGLFDGAVIRYSFNGQRFDSVIQASSSNELWTFDAWRDERIYEDELTTILSLDTEQSRTLLGMPAKMFVENILLERSNRGLISSR